MVRKKPEATKTLFLRSEKLIGGGKTSVVEKHRDVEKEILMLVSSSLAVLAKPSVPGRAAAVNETG